jgi:hypothetical protein
MPKELQSRTSAPTWDSLSPGEKMSRLLDMALDCKRDIVTMPMPDPNDDSLSRSGDHRTSCR